MDPETLHKNVANKGTEACDFIGFVLCSKTRKF
jgi:hypothetical protein